jgi:hypothetical protein
MEISRTANPNNGEIFNGMKLGEKLYFDRLIKCMISRVQVKRRNSISRVGTGGFDCCYLLSWLSLWVNVALESCMEDG